MPKQRLEFEQWMRVVDALVQKKVGLSAHDLDDQPFRDWYDEGETPLAAAREAVRATKAAMGME